MANETTDGRYYPELSAILDLLPVRIFWKDLNLRYLGCNQKFAEDAGCNSPKEVIGKTDFELSWSENAKLYRSDDVEVIETGKSKTAYKEPQYCQGKKAKWLLTSKQTLRHDGQIVGVVGTYDDISELRDARFLQEKKSRLEVVGRMAAGVAHDVNNLLVPITLSADLVCSRLPENALQLGRGLNNSIDLIKSMTTELLAFANESPESPIAICPTSKVQELLPLLNGLIGEKVIITSQLSPPNGVCIVDSVGFDRVMVNLVKNANDAMPSGGSIVITSSVVVAAESKNVSGIEGGALCWQITVSDTGPGIPSELLGRIFEPFVSKKLHAGQKGLGLGLAICSDIIARAGGNILAENKFSSGAEFKILLPIQDS